MTVKCCLNEKKRKENVKKENCMTIYETGVKKKEITNKRQNEHNLCATFFSVISRKIRGTI